MPARTRLFPALRAPSGGERARRTTQLDAAYRYIYDQIARGQVEPGAKLSRRRLATEIGVSPALVQHALGQLENAGLVECRSRSGTYVRELTVEEFANLCDVRELVEPYAAARAAERITSSQIKILEASCRRYRDLEARIPKATAALEMWQIHHALIEEEQVYHGTILAAADNDMLANLVQSLHLLGQVRHNLAVSSLSQNSHVADEHLRIVQALKARDVDEARISMLDHLQNGRAQLEELLRHREDAHTASPPHNVNGRDLIRKVVT